MYSSVCVRERERDSVRKEEKERESECVCVCVCVQRSYFCLPFVVVPSWCLSGQQEINVAAFAFTHKTKQTKNFLLFSSFREY